MHSNTGLIRISPSGFIPGRTKDISSLSNEQSVSNAVELKIWMFSTNDLAWLAVTDDRTTFTKRLRNVNGTKTIKKCVQEAFYRLRKIIVP